MVNVINLFKLDKNVQETALTYVFSHLYITKYKENIYNEKTMIEEINNRFDKPDVMIEKYYTFCNSFNANEYPLLYVFKKQERFIGYCIIKDEVHNISNEDELSVIEQSQVRFQLM